MTEMKYSQSNGKFAQSNQLFKIACTLAGVEPTRRQASKWRNRRGRAYSKRHEAIHKLNNRGQDGHAA